MTGSTEDRIAALESAIAVLEAERQIRRTLDQYTHTLDYAQGELWVDCFTADGVWEHRPSGKPAERIVGRPALEERARNYLGVPDVYRKHMHWAPVITFTSESEASVVTYLAPIVETESRPHFIVFGRFHDRMVRCDDSRWRFRERVVEIEVMDRNWAAG